MVETPRSEIRPSEDAGIRVRKGHRSGFACERETILRAQLGDATAWETLVRQNVGWILHSCIRRTGSRAHAEDMAQDVFIRVFQNLHSFRGELGGFRTWLDSIIRNLLIDDYRRNRKERRTVSYDSSEEWAQRVFHSVAVSGFSPDAHIERQERRAALRRALRLLDPDLREAVTLRDVRGLTYLEISQLIQTPVGTVKSRVNRGRIELVRFMRQHAASLPGFDPNATAIV